MCLYLPVRVRPGYGYVCTHVRRVELFLRTLVCKHCIRLILFACIISVQLLPEFCAILPMLEYCFFNIFWCCCYIVVCANTCQCCLLAWCTKCVPREPIFRGSASQTADDISGCGLSVSILRFPLVRGTTPRAHTFIVRFW